MNGVGTEQWPLRSLSVDTLLERWGPGSYVIQYIYEEDGRRRPCGTSQVIHLTGTKEVEQGVGPDVAPAAPPPPAIAVPYSPAHQVFGPAAHAPPAPMGTDPMIANVFAIMTYMNEQSERARRANEDRVKREEELRLERERIASQERVALAQLELQAKLKLGRVAPLRERDDLFERTTAVVEAKLQERDQDDEEEDDDEVSAPVIVQAPAPPPDNTAKIIDALKETLGPLLTMLATNLHQSQAAANARRDEMDDAAE